MHNQILNHKLNHYYKLLHNNDAIDEEISTILADPRTPKSKRVTLSQIRDAYKERTECDVPIKTLQPVVTENAAQFILSNPNISVYSNEIGTLCFYRLN